jgi:D-alanine transaminase
MAQDHWLLNGRLRTGEEAAISPWDRGFRFGDGLYETLRLHRGVLIRCAEHLARMRDGLAILELDLDPGAAFPVSDLDRLIGAVGLAAGEGRVRLVVTRGVDRGSALPQARPVPTCLALIEPLPAGTAASDPRPRVLATVEAAQPRPAAWAGLKSLNHLPYVLAAAAAARAGADEALLVYQGRVKETTAANLFAVLAGTITTPQVSEGLLAGVTRDWVLQLAQANGFSTGERAITREELGEAQEVFLTGSVAGIRAVAAIDGRPIGGGSAPGPVTARLQAIFAAAVERSAEAGHGSSAGDRAIRE